MKRLIAITAALALALGAFGVVHADGPQPTVAPGIAVPAVRVIDGMELALPPGYGGGGVGASPACAFALDGGVLSTPAYGTVHCQ